MATAIPTDTPKRDVHLACGNYILHTLTPDGASDRWAEWMSEPKNQRLLNAAAKGMTRDDVCAYIKRFDQKSHLLIGIFVKATGQHIGFFRLDIDHKLNRCLMFLMIGEQKYRHWSGTSFHHQPEAFVTASSIRRRSVSHGPFCWTGRIGQGDQRLHCG